MASQRVSTIAAHLAPQDGAAAARGAAAALKPAVYEFNAKLPAPVESVWAVTGAAWCGDAIRGTLWEHFPAITKVSVEEGPPEGAPGTLRRVDIAGGKVLHERLLAVDHPTHVATYTFEKPRDGNWGNHALGYRHDGMVVTLSLAAEKRSTAVKWVVKGQVDDEAALKATMDGFYNETNGFVSVVNKLTEGPAPPPMVKGGCSCGAVQYEVDGIPSFVAYCHCQDCRDAHGAPYAAVFLAPQKALRWTKGEDKLIGYDRRGTNQRRTCGVCGVHMCSNLHSSPGKLNAFFHPSVRSSPGGMQPAMHIYVSEKAPYTQIPDDGLPRFAKGPGAK